MFSVTRLLLLSAVVLWAGRAAYASADTFLSFDPPSGGGVVLKGESTDAKYKGWFQFDEFELGLDKAAAAKNKFAEFTVRMHFDSSGPCLFSACASATVYGKACFHFRKPGSKDPYMIIELANTTITSIKFDQSGEAPGLIVTLVFKSMKMEYWDQDSKTGALISPSTVANWDLAPK